MRDQIKLGAIALGVFGLPVFVTATLFAAALLRHSSASGLGLLAMSIAAGGAFAVVLIILAVASGCVVARTDSRVQHAVDVLTMLLQPMPDDYDPAPEDEFI